MLRKWNVGLLKIVSDQRTRSGFDDFLSTFVYSCLPFPTERVSFFFKGLRGFSGAELSIMTPGTARVSGGSAERFDFDGVCGSGGGCP
jgi:hypothetical protein